MTRSAAIVLAALLTLPALGCFEIEQAVDLNKDLSGTATFKVGLDMEPMITIMAQVQKEMSGDKSPLTKEEIARAKEEFKKSSKRTGSTSEDPRRAAESGLPPGVKLVDAKVDEKEFGVTTTLKFTFEKLAALVAVNLASSEGGDPTRKAVIESPFKGLQVSETAETITIRTAPQNPAEEVRNEAKEQAPKIDPETEKMMNDAFKNLRVAWKITAPFEVLSTNATRREGKTLVWEFDLERFKQLEKSGSDPGVQVTYRR